VGDGGPPEDAAVGDADQQGGRRAADVLLLRRWQAAASPLGSACAGVGATLYVHGERELRVHPLRVVPAAAATGSAEEEDGEDGRVEDAAAAAAFSRTELSGIHEVRPLHRPAAPPSVVGCVPEHQAEPVLLPLTSCLGYAVSWL
jgi:hypothetical protein